jgi:hypothetical protein
MRSLLVAFALLAILPGAALAQADTSPPAGGNDAPSPSAPAPRSTFDRAHVGVEGLLGIGTPLGAVGVSLFATPHPLIAIDAGVGVSLSGYLQKAAMVRLNPVRGRIMGVSLGVGLSSGEFAWRHKGWDLYARKHWDEARWANVELSLTMAADKCACSRATAGSSRPTPAVRIKFSMTTLASPSTTPTLCSDDDGTALIYTGAAIRFATPIGL